MKKLIFILLTIGIFCGLSAIAEPCQLEVIQGTRTINTPAREALQGAQIMVVSKTGQVLGQMPADSYMVVPRSQMVDAYKEVVTCHDPAAPTAKKYSSRVSLLGGYGAQEGLRQASGDGPGQATVESRVGVVGGVMGQRMLTERVSIGLQLQTNKTGLGVLGYEF